MSTTLKILPIALAAALVTGCASTGKQEPMKVPSGDLDYKPAPVELELDVQSRMPRFELPAAVADIVLMNFRATAQPVRLTMSQLATAYDLNIAVDQDVEGEVTVDLTELPLEKVHAGGFR